MKLTRYYIVLILVLILMSYFINKTDPICFLNTSFPINEQSQSKPIWTNNKQSDNEDTDSLSFQATKGIMQDVAGITGIQSAEESYPPLLDSNKWKLLTMVDDDQRVAPGGIYKTENGLGLLYVTRGRFNGKAYAAVGGLMATKNLIDWKWYENNPVLDKYVRWNTVSEWGRIMPYGLIFDSENEHFVAYYNARGSYGRLWAGQRAVGVAYSSDMINWTYDETDPLYTIADFKEHASDLIESTDNFQELGRVYTHGAWTHNGMYYLLISGSVKSDSDGNSDYQRIILESDYPDRGFERYKLDRSGMIPYSVPVHYGGIWYLPWRSDGMVGLYTAENLSGPYTNFKPLFTVVPEGINSGRSLQFRLIRWQDKWAIIYYVDTKEGRVMYIGREN